MLRCRDKRFRHWFIFAAFFLIFAGREAWGKYPEWSVYVLPPPAGSPTSIAIDANGIIWVGTTGGLAKFDKGNWVVYPVVNPRFPNGCSFCNWVRSVVVDGNGVVWAAVAYPADPGHYSMALGRFDGINWTIYDPENSPLPGFVNPIALDQDDNKWIGTSGHGLVKYDGTDWMIFNTANSDLPSNYVSSVAIDGNRTKWIGTSYRGLTRFDGTNWTSYDLGVAGLPCPYAVPYPIAIDTNNDKWIGTECGLVRFDGNNWSLFTTANSGLPGDGVYSIAIDGNGNKWIGTGDKGLVKFDDTNWTVYTQSNSGLPSDDVGPIAVDKSGKIWMASSNYMVVYNPSYNSLAAPLHGINNLIMTTADSSNFATLEYFNTLGINHSGVDLALSEDGSATASAATAKKPVHAICDGTVDFVYNAGGLYSFMKVHHPNCNGHDIIVYYGHITPKQGLTTVSKDDTIGTVKNWAAASGNNSHVHLTLDTDTTRDLKSINNVICTYQLDTPTNTITSLTNCGGTTLTKNKMKLRIGWGQIKTLAYKDSQGHLYTTSNFYISEAAMRQLGFISFFDLYAGEPTDFAYPVEPYNPGSYNGRSFFYDRNHLGEDEALPEETPVRAIGPGVIKKYGPATGYGELVVVVEHNLGKPYDFTNAYADVVSTQYILSIYGHLRPSKERDGAPTGLKVGDRVASDTIIGYVNDDAHNGDGAEHLHMGIRLSDAATAKAKDPTGWFRGYEKATHFGEDFAAASEVVEILR